MMGLTQAALAERLGVTQAAVANWENRHSTPAMRSLLALSRELRLPISAFTVDAAA